MKVRGLILRALRGLSDVSFSFKAKNGTSIPITCKEGENLMEVAHRNEVDIEGACDGQLACSTCHVILPEALYQKLKEPSLREEDLLDIAYGLTPTSRLSCQVKVSKDFEGSSISLPKFTRNFYVDGFVPKPH